MGLQAVGHALAQLANDDLELLCISAHELSLVHRFGVYLESRLQTQLIEHGLSIDLDYDRHGEGEKWLPPRPDRGGNSRFRPDLIVHRRRDDTANFLVVEWKKMANDRIIDILAKRIRLLVDPDSSRGPYGYQVGVIVNSSADSVRWAYMDESLVMSEWMVVDASPQALLPG